MIRRLLPLALPTLLALLPGCYLWHGLGSSAPDDTPADASVPRDAITTPADVGPRPLPTPTRCNAMDALDTSCGCEMVSCDDLPPGAIRAWAWDGSACVPHRGCSCAGADCGARFPTRDACESAYAACDSSLCRATGGDWVGHACGHFACGLPSPEACIQPGCDCGPGRSFAEGTGCFDDPRCSEQELCVASGGRFLPDALCGYRCGEESCTRDLPARAKCDCGPGQTFIVGTRGCAPDPACDPDPEALCTASGGSWSAICCHTDCGRPCDLLCAAPACDCGPGARFDDARGCYDDPTCPAPDGERCDAWRDEPCLDPGATCCATPGGGPTRTCHALLCLGG